MRSRAFAFLKPHAMSSQAVVTAVGDRFEEAGVAVSWRGPHPATGLAELYDRHVGPVARAALAPDPAALFGADARARFTEVFEEDFAAVVSAGRLLSSFAAMDRLVLDPDGLLRAWISRGAEDFGGGLYAARLEPEGLRPAHHHHDHDCDCGHEHHHGHDCACGHGHGEVLHPAVPGGVYVVNGFYPAERAPYADPNGPGVMSMLLEFDIPWRDFNEVVVGDENPAGALEESIRGFLYDRREALAMRIDLFDNVLHASRSAFDALCETLIWLGPEAAEGDPLLALLRADQSLPRGDALAAALLRLRDEGSFAPLAEGLDAAETAPLLAAAL
jgi:hypothetical protein